MKNKLLSARYPLLGLIGIFLLGWAAFQITISPEAKACTNRIARIVGTC
jgi:hypothetical protein